MITCVTVFTLCWLPFNALIVIGDQYPDIYIFSEILYIWFACHWLAMSHACCNPIIYCWMNSRFRSGFKCVFSKCLPACLIGAGRRSGRASSENLHLPMSVASAATTAGFALNHAASCTRQTPGAVDRQKRSPLRSPGNHGGSGNSGNGDFLTATRSGLRTNQNHRKNNLTITSFTSATLLTPESKRVAVNEISCTAGNTTRKSSESASSNANSSDPSPDPSSPVLMDQSNHHHHHHSSHRFRCKKN